MKMTGADIVVRALEDEGIAFTFGIPGTHNIELYDSLARSAKVRPVLVTDEQSASFMADGVARSSGKLAVVNVVPGAGLTHALSGIAEAYLDGIPMLVLGCGIRRDTGKAFQLHDVDQQAIARPVTKAQFLAREGADLYATIRRACRIARAAPAGPVFVEVPAEHYLFRYELRCEAESGAVEKPALRVPRPEELDRVKSLLAACRRPLLYLGLGAAGAGTDLVALAERLDAPVATTIEGKGVFPESHPLWLWCGFGAAAPPFVRKIAAGCDLTLAIGCRFSEVGTGSYGLEPPGKLVHVDIDASVFDRNYRAEAAVTADAAAFVSMLLADLPARQSDPELRKAIRAGHAKVWSDWALRRKPSVWRRPSC
jgi:acetolactate synthase-1/2/3 large subunit